MSNDNTVFDWLRTKDLIRCSNLSKCFRIIFDRALQELLSDGNRSNFAAALKNAGKISCSLKNNGYHEKCLKTFEQWGESFATYLFHYKKSLFLYSFQLNHKLVYVPVYSFSTNTVLYEKNESPSWWVFVSMALFLQKLCKNHRMFTFWWLYFFMNEQIPGTIWGSEL